MDADAPCPLSGHRSPRGALAPKPRAAAPLLASKAPSTASGLTPAHTTAPHRFAVKLAVMRPTAGNLRGSRACPSRPAAPGCRWTRIGASSNEGPPPTKRASRALRARLGPTVGPASDFRTHLRATARRGGPRRTFRSRASRSRRDSLRISRAPANLRQRATIARSACTALLMTKMRSEDGFDH